LRPANLAVRTKPVIVRADTPADPVTFIATATGGPVIARVAIVAVYAIVFETLRRGTRILVVAILVYTTLAQITVALATNTVPIVTQSSILNRSAR